MERILSRPLMPVIAVGATIFIAGMILGGLTLGSQFESDADDLGTGGTSRDPRASRDAVVPRRRSPLDQESGTEEDSSEESPSATGQEKKEADVLFSQALIDYAIQGIRDGWSKSRQEEISQEKMNAGLKRFKDTVLGIPSTIGEALAQEQSDVEKWDRALREGNGVDLLEAADKASTAPPMSLLEDKEQVEKFFLPKNTEKLIQLDSDRRKMAESLTDGATLEFGPGVFNLRALQQVLRTKGKGLRDLTIRGAGMDQTLLVLNADLSPGGHMERLHVKNCTIHCNDNYLFDQRRGVVTMEAEFVRVVGFDMGAGGSCMLSANQSFLYFRHCRIEGGYSRVAAGYGSLFDVRSEGLVSRFEDCRISHISIGTRGTGNHLFVGCNLVEIVDSPASWARQEGIQLIDTRVSHFQRYVAGIGRPKSLKFDLNDLFPDWKKKMKR